MYKNTGVSINQFYPFLIIEKVISAAGERESGNPSLQSVKVVLFIK